MRHKQRERGQVLLLVLVAMGIFLLGALGLAIDGANLYQQRQMAQTTADAAAQAGMMSVFNGTNASGAASFTATVGSNWTCVSGTDPKTPCEYARRNGFGITSMDTVLIEFPPASEYPGVTLSTVDPTNLVRATVTRRVDTTLMRLLGSNFTNVIAKGTAAIVDVVAPVPILVTHPRDSGSFHIGGTPDIKICGGPGRSIQVNSTSTTALTQNGNASVDLRKAGPNDDPLNPCTTGTGADFGAWGGPAGPSTGLSWMTLGVGHYIQPASPIRDPLYNVAAPAVPGNAPAKVSLADGVNGCPSPNSGKPCQLYSPGRYCAGCTVNRIGKPGGETIIFKPGVYYMDGVDFVENTGNIDMFMSTGFANDPVTGQGMLAYATNGAQFFVGANGKANLLGTPDNSAYKGILLFQDRSALTMTHSLGGGGNMTLIGTIYLTNTLANGTSPLSPIQTLDLSGGGASGTLIRGMIIVTKLDMGGNAGIKMQLNPMAVLHIRQVALVK